MKGKLYTTIFILLATVFFFSCKTASKMYQKGNYDEAVELAAKKLQKKPGDPELIQILQNAYSYAVQDHEKRIQNYLAGNSELKYEWVYNEYVSLQRLYDAIYHSPGVYEAVQPADYSSAVTTYAEMAGDMYIEKGMRSMELGDKTAYRDAYYHFNKALFYKPGNSELIGLKQEAYDYAVTNVVLLPLDDGMNSVRFSTYNGYGMNNFENSLLRSLQYNTGNIFVRFYSSLEARSKNIIPDQVIDFRMNTINLGRIRDNHSSREVSREVVIKETVYKKDSVVKEYGKVRARIITTNRNLYADGTMMVTIRNGDGRWLWSDNVKGSYTWSTSFATYTGDERALSEQDRQLVKTRPHHPPSDDEIAGFITKDIQNNLYTVLRNYYSRY